MNANADDENVANRNKSGSVTHKVEHSEIPNTTGTHSSEIGSLSTEMKTDDDTEEAKKRKGTESDNKSKIDLDSQQLIQNLVTELHGNGVETLLLTNHKDKISGSLLGLQFFEEHPKLGQMFSAFCARNLETTDPVASLYYFQNDYGDGNFEKFCRKFLPKYSVNQLTDRPITSEQSILVLILPIDNRQNVLDVLSDLIEQAMKKHDFSGKQQICVVHISFDGNNSQRPPNLMNRTVFEALQSKTTRLSSYINIIYTDDYNFIECGVNRDAAEELISLSYKM